MANEAVGSMFGYGSIPEFIEAFHDNKAFWPPIKKMMASLEERGTLPTEEHSFPRKDGTKGFIEVTATLDREKGEATFFAVDVSQSKALETRLREAELLYRHLFENTPVGVSRIRVADWTVVLANRALLDILGAGSIDEMNIPANKLNFYPMDKVEEGVEQLRTMGAESGVDLEVTRMDGGKRNLLVYVTLDTTGEYMDNLVLDITRLKEAESRLNEAESTYWQMFKASTVGQARVAMEDGKVQVCNEAFARMFGYQSVDQLVREFVLEKHLTDMDLWATKVASKATGGKGVGWLPSPSSPPGRGAKAQDARTVLIGIIPGVKVPMVRKDGKELTAVVSGVVYMGKGFMDLTFIDTNLIGP
jgi:PAS domain-containing protein